MSKQVGSEDTEVVWRILHLLFYLAERAALSRHGWHDTDGEDHSGGTIRTDIHQNGSSNQSQHPDSVARGLCTAVPSSLLRSRGVVTIKRRAAKSYSSRTQGQCVYVPSDAHKRRNQHVSRIDSLVCGTEHTQLTLLYRG